MGIDLSPLRRTLRKKSGEEESVRPSLTLTLYSTAPVASFAAAAADALRFYVESIPAGVLRSTKIRDDVGELTKARYNRELKRLSAFGKPDDYVRVVFSSSEAGQPGDYGCYVIAQDLTDLEVVGPRSANLARFEWPWTRAEGDAADEVFALFNEFARRIPFCCGMGGFGFSYWHADRFAADQVLALLPRYIGFEHSDIDADSVRGRTPPASWIVYLDDALLTTLGGRDDLAKAVADSVVVALPGGVAVRAAQRPPVGDVNQAAPDLGSLPSLARWMKSLRYEPASFGGTSEGFDTQAWHARFDARENGPWRNRP